MFPMSTVHRCCVVVLIPDRCPVSTVHLSWAVVPIPYRCPREYHSSLLSCGTDLLSMSPWLYRRFISTATTRLRDPIPLPESRLITLTTSFTNPVSITSYSMHSITCAVWYDESFPGCFKLQFQLTVSTYWIFLRSQTSINSQTHFC